MNDHRAPTAFPALLALPVLLAACAPGGRADGAAPSPEPFAVYDPATERPLSIGALADALAGADVVLFGEQHDDPGTHLAERRLLEALAARGERVVVGLEMFERDVQPALDAYLAGRATEADFLAAARPWPNYREDYRPLVEVAREAGWRVLASNVPRALAAGVAERGLADLERLDAFRRSLAAARVACPEDEYRRRFVEAMGAHPGHGGAGEASAVDRLYEAQCLKDETMAESILRARAPGATVVHFNGGFHSDRRLGIVPRLLRRQPGLRVVVLAAVPVDDPRAVRPGRYRDLADFVLLTRRPGDR